MNDIKYKTDYDLVHKYLNNDESAGKILYSKIYVFLLKYVYKNTKNSILTEIDKEDIIEETLLTSIELLNRYNGKSSFSTFIIGIADKKIKEFYRKKSKLQDLFTEKDTIELSTEENPLEILINKEKYNLINETFKKLSPDYKQIIQFRIFNELSYKEIAQITKKNIPALESMFRRAHKKFNEIFSELYK